MPTQPKLGAAATSMERKRIATQRGDRVREAKAMSKAYQTTHARRIAQIIQQAEADRLRGTEDGSAGGRMPDARPISNLTSPRPSDIHVGRAPVDPRGLPLLERFKAVYLAGMDEGSRPEQTWVFGLVVAIDRALRRLQEIGALVFQHEAQRREAMTTQRDADAELAQWRREQADLADAAAAALPKRTPLERVVLDMNAWLNPKDPIEFTHPERARADHQEEFLIYRSTTAARQLSDIEEQMRPIKKKVIERRSHLKRCLADLATANEQALPQLVLASHAEEREWIEQYMPALLGPSHDIPMGEGSTGRFAPPTVTPRRPKGGM